ncbi:unnamed protein product [Dibothriocephalus latus]|uniref:Uncharacterized protein n=1 Tax=Dibothriocephalus latus TaxID=60516 RepID=A0A3P6TX46_DIBLA|nr:unnamed protein product [Dibothriocephalus latus]
MLAGLVNVMQKLATVRDAKFLSRIQSAIANSTAMRNWLQSTGRWTDISAYAKSELLNDRVTLNSVNLTLVLHQRSLKLYEFNVNVRRMLNKELGIHNLLLNKAQTANEDQTLAVGEGKDEDESSESDEIDEAVIEQALSEDSSMPADSTAMEKELEGIQSALRSPQVKATLEKMSQSSKNVLVMKADVQPMDGGMLAILVKVSSQCTKSCCCATLLYSII